MNLFSVTLLNKGVIYFKGLNDYFKPVLLCFKKEGILKNVSKVFVHIESKRCLKQSTKYKFYFVFHRRNSECHTDLKHNYNAFNSKHILKCSYLSVVLLLKWINFRVFIYLIFFFT